MTISTVLLAGCVSVLCLELAAGFTGGPSLCPSAATKPASAARRSRRGARLAPPTMVLSEAPAASARRMMERVCGREEPAPVTTKVCEAVRQLEAQASRLNAYDSEEMLSRLTGRWQLVWTRDDKRPKMTEFFSGGKLLFFSLKSRLEINCVKKTIVERLHVGPFAYELSGPLEVVPSRRRIDFFFNTLKLGPLRIPIDLDFSPVDSKSTFRIIDVTDTYALARGSFHDIGLWRRVESLE